jgi:ketosteroid isomerase-like protein
MTTKLPDPVAAYYAAEQADDAEALSRCFTPEAIVRDEGATRHGRAEIAAWMAEAKHRYRHHTEVLAATPAGNAVTVSVRVSGRFPNSPVVLTQVFTLADGAIQTLETA